MSHNHSREAHPASGWPHTWQSHARIPYQQHLTTKAVSPVNRIHQRPKVHSEPPAPQQLKTNHPKPPNITPTNKAYGALYRALLRTSAHVSVTTTPHRHPSPSPRWRCTPSCPHGSSWVNVRYSQPNVSFSSLPTSDQYPSHFGVRRFKSKPKSSPNSIQKSRTSTPLRLSTSATARLSRCRSATTTLRRGRPARHAGRAQGPLGERDWWGPPRARELTPSAPPSPAPRIRPLERR